MRRPPWQPVAAARSVALAWGISRNILMMRELVKRNQWPRDGLLDSFSGGASSFRGAAAAGKLVKKAGRDGPAYASCSA
jgi:hypothetical protein